ncbi:MAG: bifunctional oligoribonuclease/PAP phosphatase NrnA [Acidimicrobiia bacterium]|nr:bifunctional oligoribonuclease/PAP phosphatase NrnA [Acidimicrobiia bacterium]
MLDALLLEEVKQHLENSNTFLLTCHIHPDGDALGSTMAMAHALNSIGKKVVVTFPDPFVLSYSLNATIPGLEKLVVPSNTIDTNKTFDIVMTFDCGSKSRLNGLEDLISRAKTFINVDHHLSNENFGDVNIIDVNAASSGSVVQEILDFCSISLNDDIATCLYIALLTDTGRFQFSSTTPVVFEQAKILSEFDVDIAFLSRTLTEEDSYSLMKLAGRVLDVMQYDNDTNFAYSFVTVKMREEFGCSYDEVEGLIELVRRSREADVACMIKEFEPGDYRVSMRSIGKIDVCDIASSFGGGGHRYAAGFSSTNSIDDILIKLKNLIVLARSK